MTADDEHGLKVRGAWPEKRRTAVDAKRALVFTRFLECRRVRDVAVEFGLSVSGVRKAIRFGMMQAGQKKMLPNSRATAAEQLADRSIALHAQGLTTLDIATRLGTSREWIRSLLRSRGCAINRPRTRERRHDLEISRLHAKGLDGRSIAKATGLHESTVSRTRKRLGLKAMHAVRLMSRRAEGQRRRERNRVNNRATAQRISELRSEEKLPFHSIASRLGLTTAVVRRIAKDFSVELAITISRLPAERRRRRAKDQPTLAAARVCSNPE